MASGTLFIISGPSGAGKGTLVKELLGRVPDLWLSISATTRAPRPGEVEGEHYFFLTRERFDELVAEDGFLEWADVHGNRYGTLREPVERCLEADQDVILEIDPQGAMQVRSAAPDAVTIFIVAPSMQELRRRIEARGAETREQIETRLHTAEGELELVGTYDHVVINSDVSKAAAELAALVESHRLPPKD